MSGSRWPRGAGEQLRWAAYLLLYADHALDLGAIRQGDALGGPCHVPEAPDVDRGIATAHGPQLLLLRVE